MLNEGLVVNDTETVMRSEMLRQLDRLKEATADEWERSVFKSLTGHPREDVDWDFEDNQAGYFTWLKSFDYQVAMLVDDGFAEKHVRDGRSVFVPAEADPAIGWSPLVAPSR